MNIYLKLYNIKNKELIKKLGDYLQFIPFILFLFFCIILNNFSLFLLSVGYFLLNVSIVHFLKILFNNPRPLEFQKDKDLSELSKKDLKNPDLKIDWSPKEGQSFPSGHTAAGMSGGLVWFQFGFCLGIIGFLFGIFVALSRIINRKHWIRDVGFSIILSIISYILIF